MLDGILPYPSDSLQEFSMPYLSGFLAKKRDIEKETVREAVKGRLIAVFQPHTYSRTAALFDEFAHSFGASDEVIITDIYAAREVNTYGVSEEALAHAIGEKALYIKGFAPVAEHLRAYVARGDTVILLGAGDVEKIIPLLSPFDK